MNATSIGVDLSKSVFQVSLANAAGRIVEQKRLSRAQYQRFLAEQPPAEIVMEACATAHHWARTARSHGHVPYLLHAQYVRPYVRRNKTDAADADALVRARRDPELKPVPVKSVDQQAVQGLHRIRQQWVVTRRQRITLARGLLAEFGISLPTGASGIVTRLNACVDQVPVVLVSALTPVLEEISILEQRIKQLDRRLLLDPAMGLSGADHMMARSHVTPLQTPNRRPQPDLLRACKRTTSENQNEELTSAYRILDGGVHRRWVRRQATFLKQRSHVVESRTAHKHIAAATPAPIQETETGIVRGPITKAHSFKARTR
jgi:hypothetical protein